MTDDERSKAVRVVRMFALNIAERAAAFRKKNERLHDGLRLVEQVACAAADVIEHFGDAPENETEQ